MTAPSIKPGWLRDFANKAALLDFTFDGYTGGNHPRWIHSSGATITTARTPSDWRSARNSLAHMERIAGRKLPRDNAAHYRRTRVPVTNMNRSLIEQAAGQRAEQLTAQAEQLRADWNACLDVTPDRKAAKKARLILTRFSEIRDELAGIHRLIDPLT